MNWWSWIGSIGGGWPKTGEDGFEFGNPHQGNGMTNHPRNYNSSKKAKAKKKNRAGKKARKRNRK